MICLNSDAKGRFINFNCNLGVDNGVGAVVHMVIDKGQAIEVVSKDGCLLVAPFDGESVELDNEAWFATFHCVHRDTLPWSVGYFNFLLSLFFLCHSCFVIRPSQQAAQTGMKHAVRQQKKLLAAAIVQFCEGGMSQTVIPHEKRLLGMLCQLLCLF